MKNVTYALLLPLHSLKISMDAELRDAIKQEFVRKILTKCCCYYSLKGKNCNSSYSQEDSPKHKTSDKNSWS